MGNTMNIFIKTYNGGLCLINLC